jgi:multidrug efflux system membrane fusion protein
MDDHATTRLPEPRAEARPEPRAEARPGGAARAPLTAPRVAGRRRRRLAWLAGLAVLLLALWLVWRALAPAPGGGRAGRSEAPPQPVGVATAATGDIRLILNALGTVTPLATVTVRTQIAGQLQQIGFTEGQLVHKGDFLIQIDPRPYQALLEQFQGQLARDQALFKQAQADLARYQTLLRQDSIARQQAEDQVFLVQQYQAAMRSDQAQIDTQQLNLTYCHITSPTDGRVGLRLVDQGNYVQPSDASGLVVVTELKPISVIFPLPEDDLPQVLKRYHGGAKLPVTAYDRANTTELATGVLATIDNQVDTTTGTWKLRALFDNQDEMLFPNQFVNARLLVDTLHDVLTVPVAAVQRGTPGTYVYLVGADDTVHVRPVKTGPVDGEHEQIVAGLAPGDRVVVDGTDRLREGAKVSIQQAASGAPGQGAAPAARHGQHPPGAAPQGASAPEPARSP